MIENPVELGYPDWGRGSISEKDWVMMRDAIKKYEVESVLEIGSGLSTLLLCQAVPRVVSYDTLPKHLERMETLVKRPVEFRWWDGKTPFVPDTHFDMAFVDGPQGARNRMPSVQSVLFHCDLLAMHDIGYIWKDVWQDMLDPEHKYERLCGGGRMSLWKANTQ